MANQGAAFAGQGQDFGLEQMNDGDVQSAGMKVFEKFTADQKAELTQYLQERLAARAGTTQSWHDSMKQNTHETIDYRVKNNQPADAHHVVDEVLPTALASVDDVVRRELFIKVRNIVAANPEQFK